MKYCFLLLFVIAGCGTSGPQMPSAECTGSYTQLIAGHSAELFQACIDADDIDKCLSQQDTIDAEYDKRFDAWEASCLHSNR